MIKRQKFKLTEILRHRHAEKMIKVLIAKDLTVFMFNNELIRINELEQRKTIRKLHKHYLRSILHKEFKEFKDNFDNSVLRDKIEEYMLLNFKHRFHVISKFENDTNFDFYDPYNQTYHTSDRRMFIQSRYIQKVMQDSTPSVYKASLYPLESVKVEETDIDSGR